MQRWEAVRNLSCTSNLHLSIFLMFRRLLFTTGLLSTLLPLASHAQTTPASSRYYVGLGANLLTDSFFKTRESGPTLIGPALTAGLQLTPRLAVQAGLTYQWKVNSYYAEYTTPRPAISTATTRINYFTLPVLLRYSLTLPAKRFHLDALGGATVSHKASHGSYYTTANTDPVYEEYSGSSTSFSLTLGPAVRYSILPNLDLTASGLMSIKRESFIYFNERLFLNVGVGANYTFGHR